jgi:hypothetical protein
MFADVGYGRYYTLAYFHPLLHLGVIKYLTPDTSLGDNCRRVDVVLILKLHWSS